MIEYSQIVLKREELRKLHKLKCSPQKYSDGYYYLVKNGFANVSSNGSIELGKIGSLKDQTLSISDKGERYLIYRKQMIIQSKLPLIISLISLFASVILPTILKLISFISSLNA